MIRLTLKDARPELTRIAGVTGFSVSDSRFIARLNEATQELMDAGDWPGVVDRYRFSVYGGSIVLPGDLVRILSVAADSVPLQMQSPWYELAYDGPGPQDGQTWNTNLLDRGETCTFQPIPANVPCQLQVVGTVDERINGVRPKIIIRGYDDTGAWVRSEINGEQDDGIELEINGDTAPKLILSPFNFLSVEAVIKPKTKGYVHLYASDGTTRYHLATYAPNETLPTYRKYVVPALDPTKTHSVLARCRKRFVPVAKDNDFLIISNMRALKSALIALQKQEAEEVNGYYANIKIATGLLKAEARSYLGTNPRPPITVAEDFGGGAIPHEQ